MRVTGGIERPRVAVVVGAEVAGDEQAIDARAARGEDRREECARGDVAFGVQLVWRACLG